MSERVPNPRTGAETRAAVRDRLPAEVDVVVEVSRGGVLKRDGAGRLEFASRVPGPFNYGSVPGDLAADGDLADVVLLGPRQPRGHRGRYPVVARVRFEDGGVNDDKWVCAAGALDEGDLRALDRFFSVYGLAKQAARAIRGGAAAQTRYYGVERIEDGLVTRVFSGGTGRARYRRRSD